MIPRSPALVALLAATASSGRSPLSALAFQQLPRPLPSTSPCSARRRPTNDILVIATDGPFSTPDEMRGRPPSTTSFTALAMSSIPDDDGEPNNLFELPSKFLDGVREFLPPPPEDKLALGGDVVALFVYTYLDHAANELYSQAAADLDVAALATHNPDIQSAASLPVWFDAAQLPEFGPNWLAIHEVSSPYAPAVAASGLAFVSLAAAWIFCGHFTGAFLDENTLECKPERAMVVTLQTWAGTALLVMALAWGSDAAWGQLDGINALSAPARGGLTTADTDFIFDSLTVLAFWRFVYNWLLGYR